MKRTNLMSKLFSDDTPDEFKKKVSDKIQEAKETGSAELIEEGEELQFASVDDSVIIEDRVADEVTKVEDNPEDEDDLLLEKVDIEEDEDDEKDFSDSLKDVEVEKVSGKDGTAISNTVPEVEITITEGVDDKEGSGTGTGRNFSIKLRNYSAKETQEIISGLRKFADTPKEEEEKDLKSTDAEITEKIEEIEKTEDLEKTEEEVEKTEGSEKPEEEVEKTKVESESEEIEAEAKELKNEVAELVETEDKESAEKIREKCDKLYSKIEDLESKGEDFSELKAKLAKYSKLSASILDKAFDDASTEETKKEEAEETEELTPIAKLLDKKEDEEFQGIKVDPNKSSAEKVFSALPKTPLQSVNPYLTTEF